MPLIARDAATATPLDASLCENSRMFLIGVKSYQHFPDRTVSSAHQNILAWLVQLMRMGMSPHGNPVHLDATAEEIGAARDAVLVQAELDPQVEDNFTSVTNSWMGRPDKARRWDDAPLFKPDFKTILRSLVDIANHLHWRARLPNTPPRRLLVLFSGHGALSAGRLVLCPSDAMLAPKLPTPDLASRKAALERHKVFNHDQTRAAALQELFHEAEKRAALPELVDVLERAVQIWDAPLDLTLPILLRNLRVLPIQSSPPSPDYSNVITLNHLQLVFGSLGDQVTLVIDACHSGGDGVTLQGSESANEWTKLGLPCRILSASQKSQLAAEATLGERRFSAATWALTHVLSRWGAVADRDAYAFNISHGNLLLRANMLLDALGFNQQLSLSAPPRRRGRVGDLAFFGQYATTETFIDPTADAGGIQLDSGAPMLWEVRAGGALHAILYVAGGVLYVLGNNSSAGNLAGQTCKLKMVSTSANTVNDVLSLYANQLSGVRTLANVSSAPATEPGYSGPTNPSGYVSYQKSGGRRVWISWLAAASPLPAKLVFVLDSNTPYGPPDFVQDSEVTFDAQTTPNFGSTWKKAEISLS